MSKRTGSSSSKQPTKKPRLARQNASGNLGAKKSRRVTIGEELKYNDVNFNTDATTTETVVALTTFAAGDTALTRDGNKIIPKSLELRILCTNEASTQSNTIRFVVVKSMQANGAAPTWFAGAAGQDVFDELSVTARRAVETASRYKIIMDHIEVVNQTNSTSSNQAYIHKYMKLTEEIITYASSASSVPITNAYYLMYLGTTAAGIVDEDVVGRARLRFVG